MKTKILISISLVIVALQACHSPDQKWDSKSSADTLNNMKDVAVDSTKSDTKDMVMNVSKDDAKFAVEAANGGLAEVVLGNLAVKKGNSQQVKDFGAMMVKDHSAANEKLMALAKSKGISLPQVPSSDEQKLKDDLNAKSGADFDKAYVKAMIKDHQDDIQTFENATKQLKDPQLKDFAVQTLPTLKMHLQAIQKVNGGSK